MHATRALLRAGEEGVAVATDFPLAFLTFYGRDGAPRYQMALEGNPHAMALEEDRLALALNAPGNPILVLEGGVVAIFSAAWKERRPLTIFGDGTADATAGTGDDCCASFQLSGLRRAHRSAPVFLLALAISAAV
jgi:hypothetical protein